MSKIIKTALFAAAGTQLLSEYGTQLKDRFLLEFGEREHSTPNGPQRTAR
jgi:hypothetical protein